MIELSYREDHGIGLSYRADHKIGLLKCFEMLRNVRAVRNVRNVQNLEKLQVLYVGRFSGFPSLSPNVVWFGQTSWS